MGRAPSVLTAQVGSSLGQDGYTWQLPPHIQISLEHTKIFHSCACTHAQSCLSLCNPMGCRTLSTFLGFHEKKKSKYLLLFSSSVVSDSLQPHGLQYARLPCPSLSPRVCSNSCPLSQWCYPSISPSVTPFSSCLQSFPASGSFPMSWLFAWGSQSILELQLQI